MKKAIIAEIKNRKLYAAHAKALECLIKILPDPQRERAMEQCEKHVIMIDSWITLLPDDEALIVRRRLIDGVDWMRVSEEYLAVRGIEKERAGRTMRTYMDNAIGKIAVFVDANDDMRALLYDTDINL